MDPITPRQSLILYLHYREGWSLRRIAAALKTTHRTVRRELDRALRTIANGLEEHEVSTQPYIEGCLSLWCDTGPRQQPRIAALCEEELASDLEARMARRAAELDDLSECMGADCSPPHKRSKGHAWTAWELAYLNATGRTTIPGTAYRAKVAGRYARLAREIRK